MLILPFKARRERDLHPKRSCASGSTGANPVTQIHASTNIAAKIVADATHPASAQRAHATSVISPPWPLPHSSRKPKLISCTSSSMPTPVSPSILSGYLTGYEPVVAEYLVSGFHCGFRLGCQDIPPPNAGLVQNLKSAFQFADIVDEKVQSELAKHRIMGPYSSPPSFPDFRVSPLGVVPKKVSGEFRMIHHLSYPRNYSVNDLIPREFSTVQYASIYDAIKFIKQAPSTVYLAKVDIKSAFRIIPISSLDRPLLGFKWRGNYYMDAVLPMGCASSCAIFEEFSTALEWIAVHKLGATKVVHVIDDFLFLASSFDKCTNDLNAFITMCQRIGVPLAPEKTLGPSTYLPFLGIDLDTVNMVACLPEDKILKATDLLHQFLQKDKATLREIQCLNGVLNFACTVIVPGRAFLRRLIDLTVGVSKPHHHIRLTREVKLDLQLWLDFLSDFNGKAFFIDERFIDGDYLQLFTDAAGGIGYGAICGKEWFSGLWPNGWHSRNISALELYPIVAAVGTWGEGWRNRSICFYTDNLALVAIINKRSTREVHTMELIRTLVLLCLTFNVNFVARHIPGRVNTLADKLSRCQVEEFKALAVWADPTPTAVPRHLLPAALSSQ